MSGFFNFQKKYRNNKLKFLFNFFIFYCFTFLFSFGQALDYSDTTNWAVLPNKLPLSIKQLICDSTNHQIADVFYVYPTLLLDKKDRRWNAEMTDLAWKKDVLNMAVHYQASAWAESGRMYVPYYRQAHIRAYDSLDHNGREALLFGYNDIKTAFQYYLEHFNNGRPIILAGHSQGSTQLILLMQEFFDGKPLQKQLIAAYLPGIGVDSNTFHTIPLMTAPSQIGGFVTWNTMKEKYDTEKYRKWYQGKACINPLTWDLKTEASSKQHKGFYYTNDRIYANAFDIKINNGVVSICNLIAPFSYSSWMYPDFHIGDINLFWEDIRQNANFRVLTFQKVLGSDF